MENLAGDIASLIHIQRLSTQDSYLCLIHPYATSLLKVTSNLINFANPQNFFEKRLWFERMLSLTDKNRAWS